jgi:predicted TIM-barrel fold metal-dependent hydrolase
MLRKLDHISRLYSKDMWRFGAPPLKPSDTFRQNVWVTPFYEDDVIGLVAQIGATRVLAGSDYPHPEGLQWPAEFADELDGLDAAATRRILRDNLAELVA